MFDDLTKEIKAQLYERAKSPLTGAFLLSWCAWNFHPVAIFFSSLSYDEKVSHWHAYYSGDWDSLLFGFIFPFVTSALFILLYPFPAKWAYHYWHWQHTKIKKIQQRLEDETPLTQEEANELRKSSILELSRLQQELSLASNANAELTGRNRALLEELAASKSAIGKLEQDLAESRSSDNIIPSSGVDRHLSGVPIFPSSAALSPVEIAILKALGESENDNQPYVDRASLLKLSPKDVVAGNIALQELENKKLIFDRGGGVIFLTHAGRLALKNA